MKNLKVNKASREEIIEYYNKEVKGFYDVSLEEFEKDLMDNFKKRTIIVLPIGKNWCTSDGQTFSSTEKVIDYVNKNGLTIENKDWIKRK